MFIVMMVIKIKKLKIKLVKILWLIMTRNKKENDVEASTNVG